MINDSHVGVLLASKANKDKTQRLQLLLTIAVAFVVITVAIFLVIAPANSIGSSQTDSRPEKLNAPSISSTDIKQSSGLDEVIRSYSENIQPALQKLSPETVFGINAAEILSRIDSLLSTEGRDARLLKSLKVAITEAEVLIDRYQKEWTAALVRLEQAFEAHDSPVFEREIENLLMLDKNSLLLKPWLDNRLNILQYFRLVKDAGQARAESKLKPELNALIQIVDLGFPDSEIASRIKELQHTVTENKFIDHIDSTNRLISQGLFTQASAQISLEAAIFPQRPQVKELAASILEEIKAIDVAEFIRVADAYAGSDQWLEARDNYGKAKAVISTSKAAITGYELSQTILRLKNELQDIINRPLRLKSAEIRQYAQTLLSSAAQVSQVSASLNSTRLQVKTIVDENAVPRSLWLESDGVARIRVQGVGYISPTKGKFINLRAGDYFFYAECKGYKDKLYKLTIPFEGIVEPIKVACGNVI